MGQPYGKRDPYHSHIFRESYESGMGIVWEAYHKAVPLLGVPENPIDLLIIYIQWAASSYKWGYNSTYRGYNASYPEGLEFH